MLLHSMYLAVCLGLGVVAAASGPLVTLDFGTFQGVHDSINGVDIFYGLPFAEPPIGNLRLRQPVPISTDFGSTIQNATVQKADCMQDTSATTSDSSVDWPLPEQDAPTSEDCLYLNVFRPSSANSSSGLPVMLWIYGGSFLTGGISAYNPTSILSTSIAMSQPVIWVAGNYRLSAWGFLPGQEVIDAGVSNLGLLDQRAALLWVNKYIHNFGGDPNKVTIFGESAGAMSVAFQLLMYGGDSQGTFRGAIMESGSLVPLLSHPSSYNEATFNMFMEEVDCANATDKLQCAREVDVDVYAAAVSNTTLSYGVREVLDYAPQVDGTIIPSSPQNMFTDGVFANVPLLIGDNQDEGTIFQFTAQNVTDDAGFENYLQAMANLSPSTIATIMEVYPQDPAQGSPYGTGDLYVLTPENKRLSSVLGDFVFHGPRRYVSDIYVADQLPLWSYLYAHSANLPGLGGYLGAFHASELASVYGLVPDIIAAQMQAAWVAFANHLDPNQHNQSNAMPYWPQYGQGKIQINFGVNGSNSTTIIVDNYRANGTAIFLDNVDQFIY